ncbi:MULTISPECIES: TonB-dependent receptor [unclassified Phenylobacterium]|uniref:TonB-dependent receptor n=1 Tax=unclassified Phenylobacterium TaxID=2640670 RepID=UPI00083AD940|nr:MULTISPECIES: TonB-dependent receptor [unclassified Phenylobacterium]
MMRKVFLLAGASLLSGISAAGGAMAQEAESSTYEVETVVVTAQKRAEDVSKVPLAITAVSGETLEKRRVDELQQLRVLDPSVNFRQSTGPQASGFIIRGVGTSSFSTGIEQSVSTVLDGVVLADPSSAQDLTDLERVEILRGPQGMLFGKNASAGVISITTRDPELTDYNGRLKVSYGEREDYQAQAVLNAPLSDSLALRVTGSFRHLKESVVNQVNGQPVDPVNIKSARMKLLWRPNDDLKAVFAANYSWSKHFCCAPVWLNATPGYIVALSNSTYGVETGLGSETAAYDFQPTGKAKIYGASLSVDYNLGDYTLTSVTGYQESHRLGHFDADQHAFDYLSFGGAPISYRNYSEELRIASPTGGRFDYVAGVYYFRSWLTNTGTLAGYLQNLTPPATQPTPKRLLVSLSSYTNNRNESIAAFAQGNLHLTDQLSIVVGARYTHDDLELLFDTGPLIPGSIPFNPPRTFRSALDEDNISWRVGPQFQVTPEVMVYASIARGYKGPGTSTTTGVVIEPEIPMTYEAGVKGTAFDRRMQFALNLYHSDFKNFQAQVFDPNVLATVLRNAGRLETQGVELQLQGRVTPDLTLSFAGAFTDAHYKDFAGVACYAGQPEPPCGPPTPGSPQRVFNAKGLRLNGTPKWTYSVTADYRRPNLIEGFDGFAQASWNWQDDVVYAANGDPGTRQKAFGLFDGEIGIEPQDGPWRVSIWAKNLFDKRWASQIGEAPIRVNNPGGYTAYRSPDSFRRVGAQIELRF